jgi:RimJ/RimL family protein N-acetyltransferase
MVAILETKRLRLETWGDEGVSELMELHGTHEVVRFLDATGQFYGSQKAEKRLQKWAQEYRKYGLGKQRLVKRTDGLFVGRAGYSLFETGVPEIGYSLLPQYWRKGYATEIASGLRDWLAATKRWTGFIGFAHLENIASRRVLEKIGMRPTHKAIVSELPMQFYALDFVNGLW